MKEAVFIAGLDPYHQQLILFPTEQCNFRCTYCYEDFKIGRMTESTIRGIENFLKTRIPSLHKLSISWFGGEPLLGLPVIRRLSKHAQALCQSYDVKYEGAITTNAYLLNERVLDELSNLDIKEYQITLDGPEAIHDMTRRRVDGKGTFDIIWENLVSMASTSLPLKVTLRIHYSESTHAEIPELLRSLTHLLQGDPRFVFHLKTIENLGGPKSSSIEGWASGRRQEIHRMLSNLLPSEQVLKVGDYVCYAAKPNSLAIRANGRIAKCTVDLSDPKNDIGLIEESGKLQLDSEKLNYWFRGYKSEDTSTLSCPAHAGGVKEKTMFFKKTYLDAPVVQ